MAVHQGSPRPATEIYWNVPDLPDRSFDPEPLRTAVEEMVDTVAKEIGETAPEVAVSVIAGDPTEELVRASQDADMVVVGSRGRGSFAQLLMGSVSSKVAHHAASPVVVIRGTG
jgi:nucleotide-binding universal stress UspA family protein